MENIVPFLVRAMTESDVAAVRQLETASFSDPWTERLLLETLQCPWDESWVLTGSRGEVCGYINLRFLGDEGELMRIAMAPDFRGPGAFPEAHGPDGKICPGEGRAGSDPGGTVQQ